MADDTDEKSAYPTDPSSAERARAMFASLTPGERDELALRFFGGRVEPASGPTESGSESDGHAP